MANAMIRERRCENNIHEHGDGVGGGGKYA